MNCNDCGTFIDAQPEDVGGYILCMNCMIEREKDFTVGRITFAQTDILSRPVKVIKKANRPPIDDARRHEIALLRLLVPKHPIVARELIEELAK